MLDWLQLVILQTPEGSRHFLQNTLSVVPDNQLTAFTWVLGVHIHHSEHSVRTEQASHQNRLLLGRYGVWVTPFHSQRVLKITKITTDIRRWKRRPERTMLSPFIVSNWKLSSNNVIHLPTVLIIPFVKLNVFSWEIRPLKIYNLKIHISKIVLTSGRLKFSLIKIAYTHLHL